ncbi:MAG: hypothetical protein M3Y77_07235 [Actinomycetota bacterium]|nr:hypothetical protein [Actinomycetota bacterium]
MTALVTIALYVLTLLAELAGFGLLFMEARAAGRALRDWQAANPKGNPEGSCGQVLMLNAVVPAMLGEPRRRWLAVILIGVGIVLGFAANVVSLYVN